jgi:hypothetical protein
MNDTPQLPDDFVEGYWEVVVEELLDMGLSEADAKAAAAGYRAHMKRVEWTVYNDSTAESARMSRLWLNNRRLGLIAPRPEPTPSTASSPGTKPRGSQRGKQKPAPAKRPLAKKVKLPSSTELRTLPRWAQVAFAARCARRVAPIYRYLWPDAPQADQTAVENAIRVSESAAGSAAFTADAFAPYAFAAFAAAAAAAVTYAAAVAKAAAYAVKAAAAAYAAKAAVVDAAAAARYMAEAAATDDNNIVGVKINTLIRRDFDALLSWARNNSAADSTPCPPVVAGPLWPEGVPKGWPALPTPQRFGLTIQVPDEVDLNDEREATRLAAGLAKRFARLDIVGGGHGLILKPPLKLSAVYAKARVPVRVGGGTDEEPPAQPKAGQIQVTIAVADDQDDASILTAVVQALQGGPVFTPVPDHGTPLPAEKPKGTRKSLSKKAIKKAETAIGDGLRAAAEELLPPGTSPRFDPVRWVGELQTLWNELDGFKCSGYMIAATLIDESDASQSSHESG